MPQPAEHKLRERSVAHKLPAAVSFMKLRFAPVTHLASLGVFARLRWRFAVFGGKHILLQTKASAWVFHPSVWTRFGVASGICSMMFVACS